MKEKLFICMTHLPYPVRKNGISIRYFPIIEHLSKRFDIHLLVVADYPVRDEEVTEAEQYVKKCSIYIRQPLNVSLAKKIYVRLKTLLPSQLPFPMHCYDEAQIERFIETETAGAQYDAVLCVCPPYAHIVLNKVFAGRYVMDAIDSVYVYMMREENKTLLEKWDTLSVKRWENQLIRRMHYSSFVSERDIKLLCEPDITQDKVGAIPNGIYINDYIESRISTDGFVLGYLGHMGYTPNIEAAKRLASLFIDLKKDHEQLRLFIIGRMPTEEVRSLGDIPGVTVTGDVDNIWPYVNAVDTFVFPMARGAGQQNKLLEAMFAGRPVVSTSVGNGGVGAVNRESALIADSDEALKVAICTLVNDDHLREKVGEGGRRLVTETYHWPAILTRLEQHYFPRNGNTGAVANLH